MIQYLERNISRRCENHENLFAVATSVCTLTSNICGSSARNWQHISLLCLDLDISRKFLKYLCTPDVAYSFAIVLCS
jgi:hypothetical protein